MTKILVIKFGALGDVIRTAYILPGLREKYGPDVRIWWITRAEAVPLLRFCPYVDEVIPSSALADSGFRAALLGESFDWVISLDDERETCELASALKAKRLSGAFLDAEGKPTYSSDTAPWFDMGLLSRFGRSAADDLKRRNDRSHDEIFAAMLQLKIEEVFFFNNPISQLKGKERVMQIPGIRVGLNLSAGRRWPSKALRIEEAIRLIAWLRSSSLVPVLIGGREDKEFLAKIAEPTGAHVLAGFPLAEFAGTIGGLDLLVTSDSLALHLAIAQKVRSVSFYAPTSAAEINTFGRGLKVISASADYCNYRPDADNSDITADRLGAAIKQLLDGKADTKICDASV